MYLTFDEYQEMGGTLDETTFNDYLFEAESYVDWYTFNRLRKETEIPLEVKKCVYHIIKLAEQRAKLLLVEPTEDGVAPTAQIASQSNDGVSISYNVLSANTLFNNLRNEISNSIKRFLSTTVNSLGQKVLYRGIYPNE